MTKTHAYYIFSFLLSLFLVTFSLPNSYSQDNNQISSIQRKFVHYTTKHPQQKVYLHLDKTIYDVADRLWIKAYVVNAINHKPDSLSNNLYIELINPNGVVSQNKILKLQQGTGNGDFSFTDTIPEGRYMIRAYTNWMKNESEDFFFTKNIYIKNSNYINYASRENVKSIKKAKRNHSKKQAQYTIRFYAEGGDILSDTENLLAFQSTNELGEAISVKAELYNNKNNLILTAESNKYGYGSFKFSPKESEKYIFKVKSDFLKEKSFKIPEAIPKGINLRVQHLDSDSIRIFLNSNIKKGDYPPNTDYYLFAHTRGKVRFTGIFNLNTKTALTFPKDLFPEGICHLTLMNYRYSPISERLIFIKHSYSFTANISTSSTNIKKRSHIDASILIKDKKGLALSGNYSLAVIKEDYNNRSENIISNLLLSSDLPGYIENPSYYFENDDIEREKDLDLLLLCHGWKRFKWNEIIDEIPNKLEYTIENKLEISGKISRELFDLPLKDIKVRLTILDKYNDTQITRSDVKGNFSFTGLDYYDTIAVKIEAEKENGRKNLLIKAYTQQPEKLKDFRYQTNQYLNKPGQERKDYYISPEEKKKKEEEKDPFYKENNKYNRIHSEPNDVIIVDESMSHYQNIAQLIQGRVPGVNVSGNNISIRGRNSFYGSNEALYILDGIPVDQSAALSIPVSDIDRIEILKGPEAAIYGSRGGNGVIVIFTKRGKFMIKGVLEFDMLAYASPTKFYSPDYSLQPQLMLEDDRTTLLWIPMLHTNEKGMAKFDFYSSDIEGNYIIIMEGIGKNGVPVYKSDKIQIR